MARYVNSCVQELPLVQPITNHATPNATISFSSNFVRTTSEHLQASWLKDQLHYFDRASKRYERLENRLRFVLLGLFTIAVISCLTHFLPERDLFSDAKHYAIFGPAVGPALAASLLGIATHAEWARLHRLYAARATQYNDSLQELKKITHAKDSAPTRHDLALVLKPLALTSIQEIADWRWLHVVHDPHLG